MLSSKKKEGPIMIEQDQRASRFGFLNEQDSRYLIKNDPSDNINVRLATNFSQLVELLNERRILLLRKIERMFEQHSSRIEAISKGRIQDLKNEVRLLRDEGISNLIDNSERMSNTKNLLRRIVQQPNFAQFESMQKVKGKKYYDFGKQFENELNIKNKKYNQVCEQMDRLNDKQQQMLSKIEQKENELKFLLRRKQSNYLKKADTIQDEIQKYKVMIRDNKIGKDKKKKEIEILLSNIMDSLINYENQTNDRISDIQNLFGRQDASDFDRFVRQLQGIIQNKFDERKDEKKKRAVDELKKLASGYEAYIQQLNKQRHLQAAMLEDVNEGLKNMVKVALIEKVYFQQISNDRNRLSEVLKKCKNYKSLLDNFQGDRIRLNKQLNRINHMKNIFGPKLKVLASEEMRKQELKKQLNQMQLYLSDLQKLEKKFNEFQYMNNSYGLARQTIERQMDDFASKGNLIEYKAKLSELQNLDRQYEGQKQSVAAGQYERLQAHLNGQVNNLYSRYADLISNVLMEGQQLNSMQLVTKLTKRLSII